MLLDFPPHTAVREAAATLCSAHVFPKGLYKGDNIHMPHGRRPPSYREPSAGLPVGIWIIHKADGCSELCLRHGTWSSVVDCAREWLMSQRTVNSREDKPLRTPQSVVTLFRV